MDLSEYVTIITTVPETHADIVRETMGRAGAGKVGNYSHCSFSVRGIGRFMPDVGANPHIGKVGVMEKVVEERIEAICRKERLEEVLDAIKNAHPYEETVIDIYLVYKMGMKRASNVRFFVQGICNGCTKRQHRLCAPYREEHRSMLEALPDLVSKRLSQAS